MNKRSFCRSFAFYMNSNIAPSHKFYRVEEKDTHKTTNPSH